MIKKQLLIGYLIGFNIIFSLTLITSFLPIYLDTLGITLSSIGLIFSFAAIIAGIIRFPLGTLTDKFGRKPLMLLGTIGYPVFAIGVAFSNSTAQFITLKIILEIFGAIFWIAFWAYLYDSLHRGSEGKEISYYRIISGAGTVLAPIFAGAIIFKFGFSTLFYLSAVISLANIILLIFVVPETVSKKEPFQIKMLQEEFNHLINIKKFRIYTVISVIHNLIWPLWFIFFPIYLSNIGLDTIKIGIILSANAVICTLFEFPLGKLIDNLHSRYLLIPGFLIIWASGYWLLIVKDFLQLAAGRALMGVGYRLTWEPITARISHITPQYEHGSAIGLFRALNNFAVGIMSVIGGWLSQEYGIKALLFGSSTFALGVALGLIVINMYLTDSGGPLFFRHHLIHLHPPQLSFSNTQH